jgi:5-methylcytosine-specific restriction enzyme A
MGMPIRPPTFRAHSQPSHAAAAAAYDASRGSARDRGYSAAWDKASKGFLRSHPLCLGCNAVGRVTAAELTDHVEPHKGDWIKFWDTERWQPACRWHHDVVKQRLETMFARYQIVVDDLWLSSAIAIKLTRELDVSV